MSAKTTTAAGTGRSPEGAKESVSFSSGWRTDKLGNLTVKIGSGSTPRGGEAVYKPSGVPLIRSMNVHFSGFKPDGLAYIDEDEAGKLRHVEVQTNDVLLNITGASIGRVTTAPESLAGARVNQHVCIIRPTPELFAPFLAQFLASPDEQARVMNVQVGATRQALTKSMVENWVIPLPPPSEQRRIVAEIEKQFTRLEAGVAALRRVQANLKRYRAAVLKAACEGRLVPTEAEMVAAASRRSPNKKQSRDGSATFESGEALLARILTKRRQNWMVAAASRRSAAGKQSRDGSATFKYKEPAAPDTANLPPLPEGWTWATTAQVSFLDVGFAFKSAEFEKSGIRLLRGDNLEPGNMRWLDTRFWPESKLDEFRHLLIREGEIVLAMDRPLISSGLKIARARVDDLPCLLVQRMARFRPVVEAMTSFLFIAMNTHGFIKHLLGGQTGTQLPHISGDGIQSFPVALPPLAEQTRIVAEVERRLSVVEELESVVSANLQRAVRLRQSILKKAFKGELV